MTGVFGKSRNKINDDVDSFKFVVDDFYTSVNSFFQQKWTFSDQFRPTRLYWSLRNEGVQFCVSF